MHTKYLFLIISLIQFIFILLLFQQSPKIERIELFENDFEEVKFQNQEIKNLLLSIKAGSKSSLNQISQPVNNIQNQDTLSFDNKNNSELGNSFPVLAFNKNLRKIKNYNLIQKNYDDIENEYFKTTLYLADEIIDRAIYAGEFTQGDAEQLNSSVEGLDIDDKVFIMNKLSHAYNSQKIKGRFINFKLVSKAVGN